MIEVRRSGPRAEKINWVREDMKGVDLRGYPGVTRHTQRRYRGEDGNNNILQLVSVVYFDQGGIIAVARRRYSAGYL